MKPLADFHQVILTWGSKGNGSRFYGIGKHFASEQWRMIGDDTVSVIIPRTEKGKALLRLLNTIDFSSELNPDRWIFVGRIIDTPERLRKAGCSANKVLLVDVEKTTEALMEGER